MRPGKSWGWRQPESHHERVSDAPSHDLVGKWGALLLAGCWWKALCTTQRAQERPPTIPAPSPPLLNPLLQPEWQQQPWPLQGRCSAVYSGAQGGKGRGGAWPTSLRLAGEGISGGLFETVGDRVLPLWVGRRNSSTLCFQQFVSLRIFKIGKGSLSEITLGGSGAQELEQWGSPELTVNPRVSFEP